MEIHIETIPYKEQAYDTVGNYGKNGDKHWIHVSKLKGYVDNNDELMGVIIHELVEMILCNKRKISFKDIDKWDTKFKGSGEPGEAKGCPYKQEHLFANKIEQLFLKECQKPSTKN